MVRPWHIVYGFVLAHCAWSCLGTLCMAACAFVCASMPISDGAYRYDSDSSTDISLPLNRKGVSVSVGGLSCLALHAICQHS